LVVAVGHPRGGAPHVDVVVPGLRGGKGHEGEAFPPNVGGADLGEHSTSGVWS
jgi:hypothetical protein